MFVPLQIYIWTAGGSENWIVLLRLRLRCHTLLPQSFTGLNSRSVGYVSRFNVVSCWLDTSSLYFLLNVFWLVLNAPVPLNWFFPGSVLDKLLSSLCDLKARLDSRRKVSPAVFADNMKLREETHHLGKHTPLTSHFSLSLSLSLSSLSLDYL